MTNEQRNLEFTGHMIALEVSRFEMVMCLDPCVAVAVIALIQLALRHPRNVGPTAETGWRLCEEMIEWLDEESPGFGALLRRGFDPSYDVR